MAILSFISSPLRRRKKPPAKQQWKLALLRPLVATAPEYRLLTFIAPALIATGSLLLPALAHCATLVPADLILKNGRVYTDPLALPNPTGRGPHWSQAIAIRNGNISSIGHDRAVERERGPETKVIDLKGRVVLPGFNDSHVHVMNGGLALLRLDLHRVTSIAELQEKLKAYAAANPSKPWIFGQGWEHERFAGRKLPTRGDLDAVVNDRPVMLWHADHHIAVLNTRALQANRITAGTPSPKGGEIQKDESGGPTGVLFEEAAFQAEAKVDRPSVTELREAFLRAQELALRFGVTSIQGGPIRGEDEVKAIEELLVEKKLKLRYSMWGNLDRFGEFVALKQKYKRLPEEWVRFDSVKGFIDGVLGSRTAALTEPYSDEWKTRGEPMISQDRLNELILSANRQGLAVALHAVGDRAVTMSVAAMVAAKKQLFNSSLRNRIEHLEVVPPFVFTKFTDFNIIASFQPSHMIFDTELENYNLARLGAARLKTTFALKSFLVSNAHLAFGSDWPVESLNPMAGLFAAVYRQNRNGRPVGGWQPVQKLSMQDAIDAYTLGGAYATREDHVKGSLRDGKFADLVVLERDPFKANGKDLLDNGVFLTIVDGKIVYDGSIPQLKAAQ